jgi:phosphoribosyl 1,2-cyclic phosphate phosphodiesterase
MKISLLGTAAAEGYPGLFCECEHCRAARAAGGKNLRLRSSALINDDLLIDPGPDLLASAHRHRLSLSGLRVVLVTHFHDDHWLTSNFLYRDIRFRGQPLPPLPIFGGPRLEKEIAALCQAHEIAQEDLAVELCPLQPSDEFVAGDYKVKALPAAHSPATEPFIYTITQGASRLIYATDTGPLSEATWAGLAGFGANLLLLEYTLGDQPSDQTATHMNREDFFATVAQMKKVGALARDGKIVAFHFSHHRMPLHEELAAALAAQGVIAAYDGMEIDC